MDNYAEYKFMVGQRVGLRDIVESEDSALVEFYTVVGIEYDNDMPIEWVYLRSEIENLNIHMHPMFGSYCEMIESVSNRVVIE